MNKVYERGMALAVAAAMLSVQTGCLKKSRSKQSSIHLSGGDRFLVDEVVLLEGGADGSSQTDVPVMDAVNRATGVCFLNLPRIEGKDPDTADGRMAYKEDAATRVIAAEEGLFANQYPISLEAFWAGLEGSPTLAALKGQARDVQAKQAVAAEDVVKKAGAKWGIGAAVAAGGAGGIFLALKTRQSVATNVAAAGVANAPMQTLGQMWAANKRALAAQERELARGGLQGEALDMLKSRIEKSRKAARALHTLLTQGGASKTRYNPLSKVGPTFYDDLASAYSGRSGARLRATPAFLRDFFSNVRAGRQSSVDLNAAVENAGKSIKVAAQNPTLENVTKTLAAKGDEMKAAVSKPGLLGRMCARPGGGTAAKAANVALCGVVAVAAGVGLTQLVKNATAGKPGGTPPGNGGMGNGAMGNGSPLGNLPPDVGTIGNDGAFISQEEALMTDPSFEQAVASSAQVSTIQLTLTSAFEDTEMKSLVAQLGSNPNGATCQERLFPSTPVNAEAPNVDGPDATDPTLPEIRDVSAPVFPANGAGNVPANVPANGVGNVPANGIGNVPANVPANGIGNVPANVPANGVGNVPANFAVPAAGNGAVVGNAPANSTGSFSKPANGFGVGNAPANSTGAGNAPANSTGAGNAPANSTAPTNDL